MAKKRDLSDFLAGELLYDYVTGGLDDERRMAVEECLRESEEVSHDLKALTEGIKYCETLRNTKLSEPLFVSLNEPPKTITDHAKAWSTVRTPIRYSIEALVVAFIIGVIIVFIPKKYRVWESDGKYTVIESRKESVSEKIITVTTTTLLETRAEDFEAPVKGTVAYGPQPLAASPKTFPESLLSHNIKSVVTTTLVPTPINSAKAPVVETAKVQIDSKKKGELFRIYVYSDKVDEWTPQFVGKILELGGEKAGEVQLGWKRKQGSYFHFALPESKYEDLKNYLQTFGPVRIVKEPHPRVMPEGQIRLILWLEETSQKKNAPDGEPKTE